MAATADRSKPYFPKFPGKHDDVFSNEDEATSTCFCGAVQVAHPVQGEGYLGAFVCNCTDCRKVTASMFASNFTIKESHLRFIRGKDNLKSWGQKETPTTGGSMTNSWCDTCGTLMWRAGSSFPGTIFMRMGTVDDLNLHETKLRPVVEHFTKDRVTWFTGVQGEGVKCWKGFGTDDV